VSFWKVKFQNDTDDMPDKLFYALLCKVSDHFCVISSAPVQMKELAFSAGIASHDLTTKLKQVETWLDKKQHVRITLRAGHANTGDNLVRKKNTDHIS